VMQAAHCSSDNKVNEKLLESFTDAD